MSDKPILPIGALLGPVRRWRDGDILYAENDLFLGAYVMTEHEDEWGKFGWHGPRQIGVTYIDRETAKQWDKC